MIVDIGTGDGRFVYRSARANPDKFYIGIDAQPGPLVRISQRADRKPEKGGVPNALFMHASVEELPTELNGIADEIKVHFPWASLLRAVAVADERVFGGLRRIAAPGAGLTVLIGIDEARDSSELQRLRLPSLTEEFVRSELKPRYAMAGFDVHEYDIYAQNERPHIDTTWAKRLKNNGSRRLLLIDARAVANLHSPPVASEDSPSRQ